MKSLMYAAVYLAVLLGTALAHLHLPKGELKLRTYPKVSAAEFAVMREDALRLIAEDTALGAGRFGNSYFELSCRGEPALLVDNSLEKLVIVLYAGGEIDAPCDIPITPHWSERIVPGIEAKVLAPRLYKASDVPGTSQADRYGPPAFRATLLVSAPRAMALHND